MDLCISAEINGSQCKLNIDSIEIQKMLAIYNAIEDGWKVEKRENSYVFKKLHESKTEYFSKNYLKEFIQTYFMPKNN
jgi:hypothetical protein